jgi:hypothetical protein
MTDNMGTVRGPVSTERFAWMVWGAIKLACKQDGSDGPADNVLTSLLELVKDQPMAMLAISKVQHSAPGDRVWPTLQCLREYNKASTGLVGTGGK